jgi:hypothetical protein
MEEDVGGEADGGGTPRFLLWLCVWCCGKCFVWVWCGFEVGWSMMGRVSEGNKRCMAAEPGCPAVFSNPQSRVLVRVSCLCGTMGVCCTRVVVVLMIRWWCHVL